MEKRIAIIGGGPAGLMAAEMLCARGMGVDIYEAMPSLGRKFLMAGKSGLNITHAEDLARFLGRYGGDNDRLDAMVRAFDAGAIVDWMAGLEIAAHTGPTGRVFPTMMKASPLLRAWLLRLQDQGAVLHTRHYWTGWDDGALVFRTPDGEVRARRAATVLAMGGASWRRLGSDGKWRETLAHAGVQTVDFAGSNCGFKVAWTRHMATFEGKPVKSVGLRVGNETSRGEFVITRDGVESGGIYALSAALRTQIQAGGEAVLTLDLLPDVSLDDLTARLSRARGKASMSSFLRKAARLEGVKLALLYEVAGTDLPSDPRALAAVIKALPLKLSGMADMDTAISTVGGVSWDAVDERLMLRAKAGVFCAGEMLDWDAPTGGYLLTACFATGRTAGAAAADYVMSCAAM
jgi:hypothetical protein